MHQGEILRKYLEDMKIKPSRLSAYLGNSDKTVYSWFVKETLNTNIIVLICSISDLTFADFGLDHPINPFKMDSTMIKGLTRMAIFPNEDVDDIEILYTRYFHLLSSTVIQTKKHFYVYDYLAKMQNKTLQKEENTVHRMFKNYLNVVDDHLNKNKIRYIRILALPLSSEERTKSQNLEDALSYLFIENLEHIWLSFKNKNFTLLLQSKPVKLHSFAVIDENQAISEYERYGFSANATPDILIVNKMNTEKNNYSSNIIKRYNSILIKLINEGNDNKAPVWEVSAFEFKSHLRTIYLELEAKIQREENEFRRIEASINAQLNSGKSDKNIDALQKQNKDNGILKEKLDLFKRKFEDIKKKLNFVDNNPNDQF